MNSSLAYIRYHIWRDRDFLILYGISLLCIFPMLALGLHNSWNTEDSHLLMLFMFMISMFTMALLLPAYLFRFLWNRRELDLYACIGLKRKSFFTLKFLLGLGYLMLPCVAMSITFLIMGSSWISGDFLSIMGKTVCLSAVLYTIDVWIAVVCHSRIDAVLMIISYFVLPFLLMFSLLTLFLEYANELVYCQAYDLLVEGLLTNPLVRWIGSIISVPSAIILLVFEVLIEFTSASLPKNFWILPSGAWLLWLALCGMLFVGARRSFVLKKAEDAQSLTKSVFMYPVIISILTLSLLLISLSMRYEPLINAPLITSIFLYFILWFIAQRKIGIHIYHVVILAGLIILSVLTKELFLMSKGFGLIDERIDPYVEKLKVDIHLSEVYGDSHYVVTSSMFDQKNNAAKIEELIELQDMVIQDAKENYEETDTWADDTAVNIDVIFTYMEDQLEYTRYYTLVVHGDSELLDKYLEQIEQMQEQGLIVQEKREGNSNSTVQWEVK